MKNDFRVSVVIPVFNAEKFLQKAVESALQQKDVEEIILVEDKSPDNCLDICKELERIHDRVRLFQHPNGENRGAAASRNLGVLNASSPFVAFLDADDYYLDDRFKQARALIADDPSIDGVYDAIGLHIYSQHGKKRYEQYKGKSMDSNKLISVRNAVEPTKLFESLVFGNNGIFHANGIVVKRDLVLRCGLFDEDLNIVEDVVLWLKLAFHGKLVAGNLKTPVARQGIHDENREPDTPSIFLYQKYKRLLEYFSSVSAPAKIIRTLFIRMMAYHPKRKYNSRSGALRKLEMLKLSLKVLWHEPKLLMKLFM